MPGQKIITLWNWSENKNNALFPFTTVCVVKPSPVSGLREAVHKLHYNVYRLEAQVCAGVCRCCVCTVHVWSEGCADLHHSLTCFTATTFAKMSQHSAAAAASLFFIPQCQCENTSSPWFPDADTPIWQAHLQSDPTLPYANRTQY